MIVTVGMRACFLPPSFVPVLQESTAFIASTNHFPFHVGKKEK